MAGTHRHPGRRAGWAALATLLASLGGAGIPAPVTAFSPTITVTTTADTIAADGQCSLREAIGNANANAAPNADCGAGFSHEIIVFSQALGTATITLASELPMLTDTGGLTIDGQGRITISGNDATRIFSAGGAVPLTFNFITLTHGNAGASGFGAAIDTQGPLVISGSTISANHASVSGGAIQAILGPVTIVNSVISDNTTTGDGSALYTLAANVSVTGTTFSGNQGTPQSALYTVAGTVSLTGTTFSGNHGTSAALASETTITGSTFSGNDSPFGTGTIVAYAVVKIETSTLSNNVGRAVRISPSGDVTITGSTLVGNAADNGGGAYSEGTLRIRNSSVRGNTATGGGGGIYDAGTLEVTNSTIAANTATALGGGIRTTGTVTLTNTTVADNASGQGGSGMFVDGAIVHLTNVLLSDNQGGSDCLNDLGVITAGNTLVRGTGQDACGLVDAANGNIVGVDPHLGALTGSPAYFPIGPASAARDAGNDTVCAAVPVSGTSQNGVARPDGLHCDIGAYELHLVTATFASNAGQDGWVRESSETSGNGGLRDAVASTLRLGDDRARRQYRSVLSFATGTLPDAAVVTGVTLRVRRAGVTGGGDPVVRFGGFVADVRRGPFGTAPLAVADFRAAATRTVGPVTVAPAAAWYAVPLGAASSAVNRLATGGGLTQVRLRFRKDDDNNATANYLSLASGNAVAASRPRLVVQYYVP